MRPMRDNVSSTAEKKILLHSDVMLRFFMETLLAIRISLLKTSETTIACRLLDLSTPPLLLLRMQAYRCYYRGRQNDCYISSPPSHYVLAPPFPPRFFHSSRQLHSSAIIFGLPSYNLPELFTLYKICSLPVPFQKTLTLLLACYSGNNRYRVLFRL